MRRAIRWIGFAAFLSFLALAAGCAAQNYVYKPNPPSAGGPKLAMKAAVLPFQDGTENFTKRGSMFGDGQFNLAKAGVGGSMSAMPPEFWGKSFADELAASGSFQSARFIYSPADAGPGESLLIDGTLKKVICAATFDYPNELLVSFRAVRKSDGQVVWQKEAGRAWKTPRSVPAGCFSPQCVSDRLHNDWNQWMGALLAEARMDLVATVAAQDGGSPGGAGAKPEGKPGESVEQTIDKILKAK